MGTPEAKSLLKKVPSLKRESLYCRRSMLRSDAEVKVSTATIFTDGTDIV